MADDFLYSPYRLEREAAESIRKRSKSGAHVPVKGTSQFAYWDANGVFGPHFLLQADIPELSSINLADRVRNCWIPASAWTLEQGTPVLAVHGSAGALFKAPVWELDGTAREGVATTFYMPDGWNSGSITVNVYWAPATTAVGNVFWDVVVGSLAAGSQIDDATITSTQGTSGAPGVAEQLVIFTTAAFTPANPLVRFNLVRYSDLATDTFDGVDAWFLGMKINYTADM